MGFVGMVRSLWAIGEWAESHWIIGAISFHKIRKDSANQLLNR